MLKCKPTMQIVEAPPISMSVLKPSPRNIEIFQKRKTQLPSLQQLKDAQIIPNTDIKLPDIMNGQNYLSDSPLKRMLAEQLPQHPVQFRSTVQNFKSTSMDPYSRASGQISQQTLLRPLQAPVTSVEHKFSKQNSINKELFNPNFQQFAEQPLISKSVSPNKKKRGIVVTEKRQSVLKTNLRSSRRDVAQDVEMQEHESGVKSRANNNGIF